MATQHDKQIAAISGPALLDHYHHQADTCQIAVCWACVGTDLHLNQLHAVAKDPLPLLGGPAGHVYTP